MLLEKEKYIVWSGRILKLVVTLVFLFFFSSLVLRPSSIVYASALNSDFPTQVCFQNQCLTVEVADSDDERMRGLQYRTSLGENQGMLFVFPNEAPHSFWMKDTFIALDMIWLNSDRKIVSVHSDVQPCQKDPCPTYGPGRSAMYVLEANAGYFKRLGLKVGDEAVFK